jgi:DUF4097 and DUF4098 domain-containing protein YvlB
MNINLGTPEISTDLSLSMTSGKGEVTLNDLNARTISLGMTSGTVTMKLNEKSIPKESFVVDMTSGEAEIHIPKNVGIRVTHDITSGNLQVGEIKVTKEGVFTSDNFDTAEKKLEMRFDMTSGRVKIIRD